MSINKSLVSFTAFSVFLSLPCSIESNAETDKNGFEYSVFTDYISYEYKDCIAIEKYTGNLTEVVIPEQIDGMPVTKIEKSAFKDNDLITSVTLPDSVTDVGTNAFENCTSLKYVYLGMCETYWLDFDTCTSLENIEFSPENKECFASGVFTFRTSEPKDNGKLRMENYPSWVFKDLTEFTIPDEYCYFAAKEKDFPNLQKVNIGSGFYFTDEITGIMVYQISPFINGKNLKEINVSEDNPYMASADGVLFSKDFTELIKIPYAVASETKTLRFPYDISIHEPKTTYPDYPFNPLDGFSGVILAPYNSPAYEYAENHKIIHSGDIDKNGEVTKKDMSLLNDYILCSEKLNSEQILLSDLNNDYNADVFDMITMREIISKEPAPPEIPPDSPSENLVYKTVKAYVSSLEKDSITAWGLSDVKTDSPKDTIYISNSSGTYTTVYATGTGTAKLTFIYLYTNAIGENVTYRETYDVKAYYNKYNILTVDVTKVS
ncbi:MAG: leucine-rich repeat protein [Ruminococcus sp.]|nr:leucine-rich repeat protein [Ruminococcus sp.]